MFRRTRSTFFAVTMAAKYRADPNPSSWIHQNAAQTPMKSWAPENRFAIPFNRLILKYYPSIHIHFSCKVWKGYIPICSPWQLLANQARKSLLDKAMPRQEGPSSLSRVAVWEGIIHSMMPWSWVKDTYLRLLCFSNLLKAQDLRGIKNIFQMIL